MSGYMSVLVFALYINSAEVEELYTYPQGLWLVCPLLLYWVSRLWLFVHRQHIPEDPIVFVVNDRVSWAVGCAAIATMVIAS
jgi:hypothetical protein